MKKTTTAAIAFVTFAGLAGGAALAKDGFGHRDRGERAEQRFERADADSSGDLTFEEFSAAFEERIGGADANSDGVMTVEEIAAEIERRRAERMARRIIERFDTDGDGQLTTAEIESRQKKMFALLDGNDDGKLEMDEVKRHRFGRHGKHRHRD